MKSKETGNDSVCILYPNQGCIIMFYDIELKLINISTGGLIPC